MTTGLQAPFYTNTTVSFYALDPITKTPIAPLPDVVPGITPIRITFTHLESEDYEQVYKVTERTLADLTGITSNVHRELRVCTFAGSFNPLGASIPSLPGVPTPPTVSAPAGVRPDLFAVEALEQAANLGLPMMIASPRVSFPTANILFIKRVWTVEDGEQTPVIVGVREARYAGPTLVAAQMDTDSLAPGNVQDSGATGGASGITESVSGLKDVGFGGSPTVGT